MTKDQAKQLQDALQTQTRCANRLMYPAREPGPPDDEGKPTWVITEKYEEADLWVTAQKVIDVMVDDTNPAVDPK